MWGDLPAAAGVLHAVEFANHLDQGRQHPRPCLSFCIVPARRTVPVHASTLAQGKNSHSTLQPNRFGRSFSNQKGAQCQVLSTTIFLASLAAGGLATNGVAQATRWVRMWVDLQHCAARSNCLLITNAGHSLALAVATRHTSGVNCGFWSRRPCSEHQQGPR